MLAKRIIPCLDVRDGVVVKGVRFRDHQVVGDIVELARRYRDEGCDELVFYDITASSEQRMVSRDWVENVARILDVPFCVAGGIRSVEDASAVLQRGAEKISINSPALERPGLVSDLADRFGTQCVVVGIDSMVEDGALRVYQYTGDAEKSAWSGRDTLEWAREAVRRGAGEIVLNCMNRDGVKRGYDIEQLTAMREAVDVPLIASGGAGELHHFRDVFTHARVDGALAASVFHRQEIHVNELKRYLSECGIEVRP